MCLLEELEEDEPPAPDDPLEPVLPPSLPEPWLLAEPPLPWPPLRVDRQLLKSSENFL